MASEVRPPSALRLPYRVRIEIPVMGRLWGEVEAFTLSAECPGLVTWDEIDTRAEEGARPRYDWATVEFCFSDEAAAAVFALRFA